MSIGYKKKEVIQTIEASNAKQLIAILQEIVKATTGDGEIIFTENGEVQGVTVRLIENTLSDDSKTYDIRLS